MATTVGIQEIQNRVISVFAGSEFATDLAAIRTKYSYNLTELPQPTIEGEDIYRYETMESVRWPYLMVLWDRDSVVQWARADNATERAEFRLVFGYQLPGDNLAELRKRIEAYLDAAKRTVTRAIRNNGAICDSRYIGASMGTAFTTDSSLIQWGTLEMYVDYYTTTETT